MNLAYGKMSSQIQYDNSQNSTNAHTTHHRLSRSQTDARSRPISDVFGKFEFLVKNEFTIKKKEKVTKKNNNNVY